MTYAQKLGYNFDIKETNARKYIAFIDNLLFDSKRKDLILEPIPPEVG